MVRARVREWHAEEGWGVLYSVETPGGCWTHYSAIESRLIARTAQGEARELKTPREAEVVELEW